MKKVLFSISLVSMIIISASSMLQSNTSGAPGPYAGSPKDGGSTCTNCHASFAKVSKAGWITSTIPQTGYVPGQTYKITGTISQTKRVRFGFEISPQLSSGALAGSIKITSLQTKIINTKFVTHTNSGTSGTNGKSWSFDWTAPAKGSGAITFYGAFNAANNNGSDTGDSIFVSSLQVQENLISSSTEICLAQPDLRILNFSGEAYAEFTSEIPQKGALKLYDIEGRLLDSFSVNLEKGQNLIPLKALSGQNTGLFLAEASAGDFHMVKKFIFGRN